MDSLESKLAIVTNASTDIGVAIVQKLVEYGLKVLGLDTEVELLEELSVKLQEAQGTFQYFITDLTRKQDIINAISWSESNIGPVHVLINIPNTHFEDSFARDNFECCRRFFEADLIDLNVLTREVVKNMTRNDVQGQIVFVNPQTQVNVAKCVVDFVGQTIDCLVETLKCELRNVNPKIKFTMLRSSLIRYKENSDDPGEKLLALSSTDIAETLTYILSMPPHLQVDNITLSAV